MTISNSERIKLVMAKDWWETEDLGGKIGKVKVSDGPVGLRCLAVTDSWANDSIYPAVAYSDLQVEAENGIVTVRVNVENISDRDGKEVVQLYVHEENPAVERPIRELKAFEKVLIKAHETKEVVFHLTEEAFAYYSEDLHNWIANEGPFEIQIGKNAHEILLEQRITFA